LNRNPLDDAVLYWLFWRGIFNMQILNLLAASAIAKGHQMNGRPQPTLDWGGKRQMKQNANPQIVKKGQACRAGGWAKR
jgi:hypothetical protein